MQLIKGYTGHRTPQSARVCCSTCQKTPQDSQQPPQGAREHAGPYLNLADVAARDSDQDARSPVPRRPRAHAHAGRRGRQPVACRRRKADRSALQLSWPKRDVHVAAGRRRMLVRERMAAGHIQARCGGGDDVERRVDLRALVERNNHGGPAEEAIAIF